MEIRPVILERKSQVGHGPGLTGPSRHCKAFEPNLCTRRVTEGFWAGEWTHWLKFLIDHSDCCVKNRPCRAGVKSPDQFRSSWRCHPGWTWERLGSGWGSRDRRGEVWDSVLEVDLKVALIVMRWLQGPWTKMPRSDKKEFYKAKRPFPPQMASGGHWQIMMKMWLWKRSRTWNTMQRHHNSEGNEE